MVIETFTGLKAYDESRGDDACLVMFCNDAGVPLILIITFIIITNFYSMTMWRRR